MKLILQKRILMRRFLLKSDELDYRMIFLNLKFSIKHL